ncbi:hypothetical protein H8E65_11230 [Candidatus Bathyarchaeota archaeon]|nr:hypothetical protein [Candidatus Bathyarchaeota archaeon]MBL7079753.1 hypothetical protein [Candidatus Bathyarchaeota archaeon]
MTNTLHRQGTVEELEGDYVIFTTTAREITKEGSGPKIREFLRICQKYNPINTGSSKKGNLLQDGMEVDELIAGLGDGATSAAVFTDLDSLKKVIGELIEADLGISINVSGLLDGVQECCRAGGTERHSVEQSLGFWGANDQLPERDVLALNSLCGHGLVSFNFIHKMIDYVKMRRLTPEEAARIMGKSCECGVFNTVRAAKLLEKMLLEP